MRGVANKNCMLYELEGKVYLRCVLSKAEVEVPKDIIDTVKKMVISAVKYDDIKRGLGL